MTLDDDEAGAEAATLPAEAYYQGTITRVYYGSETGVLRSDNTGREYRFKAPFVEIRAVGDNGRPDAARTVRRRALHHAGRRYPVSRHA